MLAAAMASSDAAIVFAVIMDPRVIMLALLF
jgi:hypothetical protein